MIKFRSMPYERERRLFAPCNINVTREVHEQIRTISQKTGLQIKEVTDLLMRYALNEVEWDEEEDDE